MTANPQPPPEAALIRARRAAAVPRLSMSGAAKRAARDPDLGRRKPRRSGRG